MTIVWYLSSVEFSNKTLVSGVLLRKKPSISNPGNSSFGNALMIIDSYFNTAYSKRNIVVKLKGERIKIQTDSHGGFQVKFEFCSDEEVAIFEETGSTSLEVIQNYPIRFKNFESSISIISDIDDSIMVSYTRTKVKRFLTTLLKPSHQRKVIPFTQELYQKYKQNGARFFYVSKSECNLMPTISNFISHNGLPQGNLFLTPYLSLWQLISTSKDKNFKFKVIRDIIENSTKQDFVLIGDDSQRDMEIYTKIVQNYPSKIKKVYIRQTQNKLNRKKMRSWEYLKETGIDAYYFKLEEIFSKTIKSD
ncbi:phosphatidate phosphatase App1 family protein [Lutimonas zeaxanthinifaciens]|uniref:phosphatidate phosphatase App1 family protein n=1 Tax=Lutimonas zeaxanthinifaciens TaxID=3060215 RepID=UPI00265D31CB|nr:App1 family protein [Lutimonas sp. YSD2104]WKK65913.1 App1 family protein [Lutimonas sp. YSD2104]